jgi:catechol 2,3-dioxygenase-like lactoylglutathione lyase family enzyme
VDAVPAYLGVVVRDLARSTEWYARVLGCVVEDAEAGWACLAWPNGTVLELFAGDPGRPGLAHPGYGVSSRSPMLPGYGVEDPLLAARSLPIAQRFPDWIVVVTPDELHVVLQRVELRSGDGLVGFRYASPAPGPQGRVLSALGAEAVVVEGPAHAVVPVVRCGRGESVTDPDGNAVDIVTGG